MSSAEDELVRPAPEVTDAPVEPTLVRQTRGWPGIVAALPMALAAAVAALTVVAAICLINDAYRPALVLPIGLPLAAIAGGVVLWLAPARAARTLWPNLLALAGVVVMVWFNVRYGAQDIVVTRDPGTYTVTAQWLAHHSSARIPTQSNVFGDLTAGTSTSLGFGETNAATVQSQYPNAAPMLVAMVGWLSDTWMLRFAPFIGGAALLAFFALARGVVREWWALGAMTLLAVSLPMLHFSRAVYSEPTTMLFLLGGMALLFACHERPSVPLHIVTGLTGGATALARVDGGIFLIAAAGYSVMRLAQSPAGRRRRTGLEVAALLLAALVPYGLGMRLTATLSSLYWYPPSDHRMEAFLPGVAAALVLAAGSHHPDRGLGQDGWRETARCAGAPAVVGLCSAADRGRRGRCDPAAVVHLPPVHRAVVHQLRQVLADPRAPAARRHPQLCGVQPQLDVLVPQPHRRRRRRARDRLAGKAFRSYGPSAAARVPPGLPLATALLSLAYPDITPDQIWSIRRFLPVVMPGLLIGAAYLGSPAVAVRPSRPGSGRGAVRWRHSG